MKYPISREFGLYRRLYPPVYRSTLGPINFVLAHMRAKLPSGISVVKHAVPVPDGGSVHALLYSPEHIGAKAPCLIYFHGGGFVMEPGPSHYELCAQYALRAGCKVLFVLYSMAPANVFPTQVNECFASCLWAVNNAASLGVDPSRTAVCGDSAGGCLAAAVCLMLRDRAAWKPCLQLLVYPVTDRRMQTESMRVYIDTPMWNARLNAKMWRWYMPQGVCADAAYASPMEAASFAGLPDAYIETAQFDPLHDEAVDYAVALQNAGVNVELNQTCATMHGFDAVLSSPTVRSCVDRRVAALKAAFLK